MKQDLNQQARAAIEKAHQDLWCCQKENGTWDFEGDVGPVISAQVMVILHYIGELDPRTATEGARWLASQQYSDGSFPLYPGAPTGDLGATATAWAALSCANAQHSAMVRAREFVLQSGGAARLVRGMREGELGALFAAMAGVIEPALLPRWPVWIIAHPLLRYRLGRFINAYVLNLLCEIGLISEHLKTGATTSRSTRDSFLIALCQETYQNFQNPTGSFNELTMQTAMMLAVWRSLGYDASNTSFARALYWLKAQAKQTSDGLTFSTFSSEVWATTHVARSLLASGVSASDPRISKALHWLIQAQCDSDASPLDPRPYSPKRGGWAYQKVNVTLPDTDDTAVVLELLGEALSHDPSEALREELLRSYQRGLRWLIGRQNPDGGWAAFTWGHRSKPPGPMLIPPLAWRSLPRYLRQVLAHISDPSTEGLSGRVLCALGGSGMRASSPEVRRAIEFLASQQCDFGAWWGRWLVNYIPTTACILLGLSAVGADLSLPWVQRAIAWMKSKQRDDGGFGEDAASYLDPTRAGDATQSMPGLTGLVSCALIAVGEGESEANLRAIQYLIETQREDGTWPHHGWLATYLPPRMFYLYPGSARFYPLLALGRFSVS